MTQSTRTVLKGYFEAGDRPTSAQFAELIESCLNIIDDGGEILQTIGSAAQAGGTGLLEIVGSTSVTANPIPLSRTKGGTGERSIASAISVYGLAVTSANTFTGTQTFVQSAQTFIISSTDDSTNSTLLDLQLYRDRSDVLTSAANIGRLSFLSNNSASAKTRFCSLLGVAEDTIAGNEDGELHLFIVRAGVDGSRARIKDGLIVGNSIPTGGDLGDGTINTTGGVFKNNVEYSTSPIVIYDQGVSGSPANIDITWSAASYRTVEIIANYVFPSSDDDFKVITSTDNGSTYDDGPGAYRGMALYETTGGAAGDNFSTAVSAFPASRIAATVGASADSEGGTFKIEILDPLDSSTKTAIFVESTYVTGGNAAESGYSRGHREATQQVNGVRLFWGGGASFQNIGRVTARGYN